MNDVSPYLHQLALVNRHGFGFLLAYGLTWLCAAMAWRWKGERIGAYAALFQGMVALPVAFALTAATARGTRPAAPLMDSLSTYLAMGQLMVLPLVIVTIMRRHCTSAASMMGAVTAVHFLPYAWLYQTPLYTIMAVVIALAVATLVRLEVHRQAPTGDLICLVLGVVLTIGSAVAWTL